jgi:hypothetical protein
MRSAALAHKALEQHPLVGCVLVDQVQAIRAFGHQVSHAHLPNQAQQRQPLPGSSACWPVVSLASLAPAVERPWSSNLPSPPAARQMD